MGEREEYELWWQEFSASYEEWPFADSNALRYAAWKAGRNNALEQAAKNMRPMLRDMISRGQAYRIIKDLISSPHPSLNDATNV